MERVYTTPLLDKLGIRPGMRVAIIDVDDKGIRKLIGERTTDLTEGWPEPDTDIVLVGAESFEDLSRLQDIAACIRPNGAIWVVSRKGKTATIRDVDVIEAAKAARMVDNKVCAFSPTHTALRLVIPVTRRDR
jgi:bifunctional DNA-binding transcriptional regulator/antitoxin component of YhaV-PrlF toxin-antitoxin module